MPPQSTRPGKQALVIVGMHRSGTSASTGALQCLGVHLGGKLYSGHKDINEKGYFEHYDIADANDEVLLKLGASWDDILLKKDNWWKLEELAPYADKIRRYIRRDFSMSMLWAVKDPRVCRLLPWWLDILASEQVIPHFIFVVRSPSAVHRSLERRDGFSREKSYQLWSLHYLEAERWSRGYSRIFVSFDHFLEQPKAVLQQIEQELGIIYPIPIAKAASCLEKFLSSDLRHHKNETDHEQNSPVITLAQDIHALLLDAARAGPASLSLTKMDELWRKMECQQAVFPDMLVEHIRTTGLHRGNLQITMNRLMRSWSWITGKPVRFLERLTGRDV